MAGKEVLLEKVGLKNSTYKAAIAKLEAQLAHKEEMGEVLHLVDFDQLKIENQQHMETINGKNRELLRLKLSTGRTVQVRESSSATVTLPCIRPVQRNPMGFTGTMCHQAEYHQRVAAYSPHV